MFVYFDLDDTLLDHHHAQEQAFAETFAHFERSLNGADLESAQAVYHRINVDLWQQYGDGKVTKQDLNARRFAETLAHLGATELDSVQFGKFYLDAYRAHWQWIEGAQATFHYIAERAPVGIITNGFVEIQQGKLDRFPEIKDACEAVIISEEYGVMKPHPDLFRIATEKAGVPPDQIYYIGDSFHSDVQGGLNAGWHVAWFHRHPSQPMSHVFSFSHWQDLLNWLFP